MLPETVQWVGGPEGFLRLIDQTRLPGELEFLDCHTPAEAWQAIKRLVVRGAPAIGVAAAYGVVLGLRDAPNDAERAREASDYLATSRPTAVNLFWALDRMRAVIDSAPAAVGSALVGNADGSGNGDTTLAGRLLREAERIHAEDRQCCAAIGAHGAPLLDGVRAVLTHCNAGSLATSQHGTALAVLYAAHRANPSLRVYADETRPLLQGARLTAWELDQSGIDVTVICDSMAAEVMREDRVQAVVVGADRIAANGDVANKIGTYAVAIAARFHNIPFYVAAPLSTFDLTLPNGRGIPIEQRDPDEIAHGFGVRTTPPGVDIYNPAFDVTPAELVTGIITESGVITDVSTEGIASIFHTS